MKILYTDIDYVLSLSSEPNMKMTKWGWISPFNKKAVSVYNDILEKTGALPVISSDWKHHHTLTELQEIFVDFAGITTIPIDTTPYIPGATLQKLEEFRAKEILQHVEKRNPDAWVAIDDLDLSKWIDPLHFVHCPRMNEGIKQSGKAKEAIEKLNIRELEDEYFSNWEDDSWPNYVAWIKQYPGFNIIVNRYNAARPGYYDLTKVDPNIYSASDPSGEHPEYWKDKEVHITLSEVKKIIQKYDKPNI